MEHLFSFCPAVQDAWRLIRRKKKIDEPKDFSFPAALLMLVLTPTLSLAILKFSKAVWNARCRHQDNPSSLKAPVATILSFFFTEAPVRNPKRPPDHPVNRVLEFRHQMSLVPSSSLVLFTDGSAIGNPGRAGSGFFLPYPQQSAGFVALCCTTNNRAELVAVLIAIWHLNEAFLSPKRVVFATDSSYVRSSLSSDRTKGTNPILIARVRRAMAQSWHTFSFLPGGVPAHKGIRGNELADAIANIGSAQAEANGFEIPALTPTNGPTTLTQEQLRALTQKTLPSPKRQRRS
jgi:ribonuclease HI